MSAATGETEWELALGDAGRWQSPPVAAGGAVYAVAERGFLTALDAADGAERWRYRAADDVRNPSAVTDDAVYVATHARGGLSMDPAYGAVVAALDPDTGAERWRREAPSSCGPGTDPNVPESDVEPTEWSRPPVDGGAVYASLDRSLDGEGGPGVCALACDDGDLFWQSAPAARHAPVLAGSATYLVGAGGSRGLVKLEESATCGE
jgi:outer membrane protein assembly factor BamB